MQWRGGNGMRGIDVRKTKKGVTEWREREIDEGKCMRWKSGEEAKDTSRGTR